jgi:hypothetical protein
VFNCNIIQIFNYRLVCTGTVCKFQFVFYAPSALFIFLVFTLLYRLHLLLKDIVIVYHLTFGVTTFTLIICIILDSGFTLQLN